ncbi:MAG: pyridoxal-phosphate dependent enzyme [Bacteroidota bacterium]
MAIIKPVNEANIVVQDLKGFAKDSTIQVQMLRLDAIHPIISGNKWYKLKYNIEEAFRQEAKGILTFGGAYSNHLIATAAAAYYAGLAATGVVRGIYSLNQLNPVLQQCTDYGMQLHFVSREEYNLKEDANFQQSLLQLFPDYLLIPEGGANEAGRKGAGEITDFIPSDVSHVLVSVGSATTFIGLRNALPSGQELLGFAPMKGGVYLKAEVEQHLLPQKNIHWHLIDEYDFGGFGKITQELTDFMSEFKQQYGFDLDRVYTAKMMKGLQHKLKEGYFPQGSKILCIHSGGLTGN